MSDQSTLPVVFSTPEQIQQFSEMMRVNREEIIRIHDLVVTALDKIPTVQDQKQYDDLNETLNRVKSTYDSKFKPMYDQIADPFEAYLDSIREYIRPFDYKSKTDNKFNQRRKELVAFEQKKVEEKARIQKEAEAKKERENKLVELKAQGQKNLSDLIVGLVKLTDTGSAEFWQKVTLENFEDKSAKFKQWTPKLKQEEYDKSFLLDTPANLFPTDNETSAWIAKLKEEETYEKWNKILSDKVTPIINEYRAKIPQYKQNLLDQKAAGEDAAKLKEQQDRQEAKERAQRQLDLERQANEQKRLIDEQTEKDKIENSFGAQIEVQQLGDTAPTKKVLKFTDPKGVAKALSIIIYHCLMNPKFPGLEKRNKAKEIVKDETGKPVYIDAIDWWLTFFMQNCDSDVPDTEVLEIAKVRLTNK